MAHTVAHTVTHTVAHTVAHGMACRWAAANVSDLPNRLAFVT